MNFKNLISNPKRKILTAFEVRPAGQVAVAKVMTYDLKQKVDTLKELKELCHEKFLFIECVQVTS